MNFEENSEKYYLLEILPRFAKVELNSYQQADEFEIRLDYNAFPVDPRTIRSCGVGIWMGTTDKYGELITNEPDDCLLTGFVDDFEIQFEEEDQVLQLRGRDFTGILLDTKWFHGNVPLDMKLDEAFRWILNHDPSFAKIEVVNESAEALPTLSQIKLRSYEEHTPRNEDSYWDLIYDICIQAGFICYIKLEQLIINKPRNMYPSTKSTNFVYGINLNTLKFRKSFAKQTGLNVEVRSYDPITKTTLRATYPDPPVEKDEMVVPSKNMRVNSQTVNIEVKKAASSRPQQAADESQDVKTYEFTTFIISNVQDIAILKEIAEGIWNQLHRKQIEGEFETSDLYSFESKESVIRLRNGDPISVTIGDRFKKIINSMPYSQIMDFLVNKGFNSQVASEISQNVVKLDRIFYAQKIQHEWTNEEGYKLSVSLVNYLGVS